MTTTRFKENQENSPLLRLPPEIRNIIWGHALGGKTFVAKSSTTTRSARTTLASSRKDPKNGSALLRTCRQLFLETAPYLLTHGTIEFAGQNVDYFDLHPALKAYQRDCVKRIRMSFPGVDQTLQWEISRVKDLYWTLLRLPALDEVEVLFHDVVDPDGKDFQSRRDDITKRITKRAKDKGYMFKLKVRGTSEKLDHSRLY